MTELENYYSNLQEPNKSCMLALRDIILQQDENVKVAWKWNLPAFYFYNKLFAYLWIDKKTHEPYLAFVEGKYLEHPKLEFKERTRIKSMSFNPNKDLPIKVISKLLQQALGLYKNDVIKIKKKH